MSDYPENLTAVVRHPDVSVVNERRGMSGVAVAGLVAAAITATVVITMLIVNSQQRNGNEDLAMERARTVAAEPAQPTEQLPVIVNIPPSQPATVSMPYPGAGRSTAAPIDARTAPSTASVEIDVTSRLQTDELLRPYAINVKVTGGTTTLSGYVPNEDLKKRAEKLARAVNAVKTLVNDVASRP
ncbi:MAG TPA: BON domain-containing protein [Blastocatellia bacterium]|nr:BON domain-containing protein [Blastocatellia bacterium]